MMPVYRGRLRARALFWFALLSVSTAAFAFVNPAGMQQGAPEQLRVRVAGVSTMSADQKRTDVKTVHLLLEVETVRRSASGLRSGDVIRVRYSYAVQKDSPAPKERRSGWAGPQNGDNPPPPHYGQMLKVYLRRITDQCKCAAPLYAPAAHQHSFVPVNEQ